MLYFGREASRSAALNSFDDSAAVDPPMVIHHGSAVGGGVIFVFQLLHKSTQGDPEKMIHGILLLKHVVKVKFYTFVFLIIVSSEYPFRIRKSSSCNIGWRFLGHNVILLSLSKVKVSWCTVSVAFSWEYSVGCHTLPGFKEAG